MWDAGLKLSTQTQAGRSRRLCGAEITIASVDGRIRNDRRLPEDQVIPTVNALRRSTTLDSLILGSSSVFDISLAILHESIVLERSPPVSEVLMHLVHGASSVSLGTILGANITQDPYMLELSSSEAHWVFPKASSAACRSE
jgi:hypothetical protein